MRSLVCAVLVVLLLVGMFYVFEIRVVKATGTIYIRSDGSVDGTTSIETADNVTYLLTANITASIVIEKDNMILDGNGYVVQGVGTGTGIDLSERTNVTVQNIQVTAVDCGILLISSSNDVISGDVVANDVDGIALSSSLGNIISGNYIVNCASHGISLALSSDNDVTGNNVTGDSIGIAVYSSLNNTISGNEVGYSSFGGIYLYSSDYNSIFMNAIMPNNWCGIRLESNSDYNSIFENNVTANKNGMGVFLYYSSNNTLVSNALADAGVMGYDFGVDGSSLSDFVNNVDSSNTVEGKPVYYWINEFGKTVPSDAGTVILVNCTNITVQNLNLTWNRQGILLANSTSCIITQNNIANNCFGFLIWHSSGSLIYHNNISNNSRQTYGDSSSYDVWDNGYPSGGNYWTDYLGSDMYGGPFQNHIGSDGIGDTPYFIDSNGTDNYPLMKPWPAADVAITGVTPAKTVTGPGYIINISVTVSNLGDYDETFNVTVYAGKTVVSKTQVTLTSRSSTTLVVRWNTAGFGIGSYATSAFADTVPNEEDTLNNNFTGKLVYISRPGDLTGGTSNLWDFVPDGKVDTKDMSVVAKCFGSVPGCQPPYVWNSNCDINNDGKVDIRDLSIVARNYT